MLRFWNRKTKTVTVTRNLVLELKYDTVNKKTNKTDNDFSRLGRPLRSSPARPSKLPALGSPYCHTLAMQKKNHFVDANILCVCV